jgi:hypothetical protein
VPSVAVHIILEMRCAILTHLSAILSLLEFAKIGDSSGEINNNVPFVLIDTWWYGGKRMAYTKVKRWIS